MLHLIIIAMYAVVVVHDSLVSATPGQAGEPIGSIGYVWLASLLPMVLLGAASVLVIHMLARDVRLRGRLQSGVLADRMLGVSRWCALALHAGNVLAIGWVEAVRGAVGDRIAIDELISILPPLGVIVAGWWAYQPIDAEYRKATLFRLMETGQPVYPPVGRWAFVLLNFRHQVLLALIPIALIGAWAEGVERVLSALLRRAGASGPIGRVGTWLREAQHQEIVAGVLQVAGVVAVFVVSPLILRRAWDTVRLGPGPLQERLVALCRASGVHIRDLLVWRTHGTMLNGAVIGVCGRLRYILLTDALLDQLPESQVEAVMAHEVGHARHSHMPWLAASMLVGIGGAAMMLGLLAWGVLNLVAWAGHPGVANAVDGSLGLAAGLAVASFLLGLTWFGFVSRRFEWQADAFAAQQLSRSLAQTEPTLWDRTAGERAGATIRPEAVEAMAGALDSVAELNHLPRARFTWRHGSIAYRQRRLRGLAGMDARKLPIDRTVRWLKRGVAFGVVVLLGLMAAQRWLTSEVDASRDRREVDVRSALSPGWRLAEGPRA